MAGFFDAFFGLRERYAGVSFAILAEANARGNCNAHVEEFGGELHGVAFAVDPDVEGGFWLVAFVADLAQSVDEEVAAFL